MSAFERSTKAANALGGKTARACESCLVKRARWFCSADDAFLCQACDVSVHSANLLASKHERLRLETSSYKVDHNVAESSSSPSWHQGFTKKARTPRQPKLSSSSRSQLQPSSDPIDPLVPEYNSDDYPFHQYNENEEQSVCRVPVFDPAANFEDEYFQVKLGEEGIVGGGDQHDDLDIEGLFTACDADSLFGVSKDLGFGRSVFESEENAVHGCINEHLVQNKREDEECDDEVQRAQSCHFECSPLDMELMNWDFDYTTDSMTGGEIKTDQTTTVLDEAMQNSCHDNKKIITDSDHQSQKYDNRSVLLRLDYEAIIAAWEDQDSPWIDGLRPHQFSIDEFMVACIGKLRSGPASDAEREARVSRYREKRRTRLFSKKIRYQVRKLNAENRPRIKGRFVKRTTTTFSGISYPYSLVNNS